MLGYPVVKQLLKDGFKVKVFTRNMGKAQTKFQDEVEYSEGDLGNKESILKALKDCQGVHINLNGGPRIEDYDKIEHQGTKAVVEAALKSKIEKITYLSGLYTKEGEDIIAPSVRAKYKAEKSIINSGINFSIFRATWFMESLPLFVQGNKAILVGKQTEKLSWLAVEEYAQMVSESYKNSETDNKIFDVYGPEKYTMKEALKIYLNIVLPEIKIKRIPIWFIKLFGLILRKPELKTFGIFMKYASQNGEIGDNTETNKIFGAPKITIEQWAEKRNKIILDK